MERIGIELFRQSQSRRVCPAHDRRSAGAETLDQPRHGCPGGQLRQQQNDRQRPEPGFIGWLEQGFNATGGQGQQHQPGGETHRGYAAFEGKHRQGIDKPDAPRIGEGKGQHNRQDDEGVDLDVQVHAEGKQPDQADDGIDAGFDRSSRRISLAQVLGRMQFVAHDEGVAPARDARMMFMSGQAACWFAPAAAAARAAAGSLVPGRDTGAPADADCCPAGTAIPCGTVASSAAPAVRHP